MKVEVAKPNGLAAWVLGGSRFGTGSQPWISSNTISSNPVPQSDRKVLTHLCSIYVCLSSQAHVTRPACQESEWGFFSLSLCRQSWHTVWGRWNPVDYSISAIYLAKTFHFRQKKKQNSYCVKKPTKDFQDLGSDSSGCSQLQPPSLYFVQLWNLVYILKCVEL